MQGKKIGILLVFVALSAIVACAPKSKYDPDRYLSTTEQQQVLLTTVRYLGHLPKRGSHENKFDRVFDEYYSKLALDYTLEAYFERDGFEYFLASRIAPSVKVKKVATGVKMKRDKDGNLVHYEEVFRTWKFEVPEMLEKGLMLFDKMVKGEDLSPYYPQNSGAEEFIEFPDAKVYYDTNSRRWLVGSSNPI
jgi:hypothetical protein